MVEVFLAPPRDEHGKPVPTPHILGKPMTPRELHRYRCFLLGVRDPEVVDGLWREEEASRPGKKNKRRARR